VPIIPQYLFKIEHPNETQELLNAKLEFFNKTIPLTTIQQNINTNYENAHFMKRDVHFFDRYTKKGRKLQAKHDTTATTTIEATTLLVSTTESQEETLFEEKWRKEQYDQLNAKVGFMFASKPVVQLITNPFIGPLTNRFVGVLITYLL
jgi:hypothetical protein